MISAAFDFFPCFSWILTIRNTISRYTYWCCSYKLSKVKIIDKKKLFPIIYCPFLFGCRRSWLRWDLVFIFLWLMKSTLWPLHFISKHSLISLAFLENISPRGKIPETAIWWPLSFTDKAKEIISLAISSGELTDLRSLVPAYRITRSGFFF